MAKIIYDTMFRNQKLALELNRPSCQDTGVLQFWVKCGTRFPLIDKLEELLKEAVVRATVAAPLRHNSVETFDEYNTGKNAGKGTPTVWWDIIPYSDKCEIYTYMAGGGCTLPGTATVPLLDENGQQVISKYGKPMFRKSYSVLQDKLFAHMTEAGFTGFERGVLGSTAENLSSLDYQIQKDKERLAHIQERIEAEQVRYEPAHEVRKTMAEIEGMGQKTITGKIAVSKDDYQQLTALAKEGITSRSEIQDLKSSVSYYQRQYFNASSAVERLQERYDRLKEKCQPFLQALEHFPKLVEVFVEKVKELFSIKEAQKRKEREDVINFSRPYG